MKIGSLNGRAVIITEVGTIDIEQRSGGRFSATTDDLIPHLSDLKDWYIAESPQVTDRGGISDLEKNLSKLDAPLTRPRQIFAIGLNYQSHTKEMEMVQPETPMVFTKFVSSITGPGNTIKLQDPGTNDWEVEMVAVMGRGGRNIPRQEALSCVAAYCVGQDISERTSQMKDSPAQFSMGKSYEGYTPIGPWLTTADEVTDPHNLEIMCQQGGEVLQRSRTSMMMFDIPTQIEYLSSICELYPGDLIFTGTPEGVGFSRNPPKWLRKGEVLESHIEGLGWLRNLCA